LINVLIFNDRISKSNNLKILKFNSANPAGLHRLKS